MEAGTSQWARAHSAQGIITGTGFPKVFYLAYTMYRQYFPLHGVDRLRAGDGARVLAFS